MSDNLWIDEDYMFDEERFDDILKQIRQNVDKHSKYFKEESKNEKDFDDECVGKTSERQGQPPTDATDR